MVQHRLLAVLYCALILSCLSDNLVYTLNGYRDDRDDIVQRRPTIRTENDNFILETPKNRNITLTPGPGGFVKIGNTIIESGGEYQIIRQSNTQPVTGPQGPSGPTGPRGPKGDSGSADSGADILLKLQQAGIDLPSMMEEIRSLREEVADLQQYSLKGTYPALFEFFNSKYGARHNSNFKYGTSGLMVMTEAGGTLFGQHIIANGLESGTTYAISFYLTSHINEDRQVNVQIAGSDHTAIYIDDRFEINCGDGDATFNPCRMTIPSGSFKFTLVCSDVKDVLESIGFQPNWLTYNNLSIDWTSMNRVLKKLPDSRRRK